VTPYETRSVRSPTIRTLTVRTSRSCRRTSVRFLVSSVLRDVLGAFGPTFRRLSSSRPGRVFRGSVNCEEGYIVGSFLFTLRRTVLS
jgi:hypothetical protein